MSHAAHAVGAPAAPAVDLSRVRVVLVRPQGPLNVGAAARAVKNMGLGELVLVRPAFKEDGPAQMLAAHAGDVLDEARVVDTLATAVAECSLVIGTTGRLAPRRKAVEPLEQVTPLVAARAAREAVALVFGPEDHGLSNTELARCHRWVTIDASADYPSLNLAQAVMVCAYAVRCAARAATPGVDPVHEPAPAAAVERMFGALREALLAIGFLNPQNPEHIMDALRRLCGRAGLEAYEVRILLGIARQITWYAEDGWQRPPAERRWQR